jgi:hypothetical protein
MEARKCKLCGTRHWGLCSDLEQDEHVQEDEHPPLSTPAPIPAPQPAMVQAISHATVPMPSLQGNVQVASLAAGKAPKRDRRLYMQHYRAVKKGLAEPAPPKQPFDKAAYMRDYTPRWRAARKAKATPQ